MQHRRNMSDQQKQVNNQSSPREQTILIGLSGPSSSGKTTLARLLRDIFTINASDETNGDSVELIIVHEDDFWKTDADIPLREFTSPEHGTRTLQDWDCIESLDLPYLDRTLQYIRETGNLPTDLVSKEDQNKIGNSLVSRDVVASHRRDIIERIKDRQHEDTTATTKREPRHTKIYILDGFLMYPPPPPPPADPQVTNTSTPSMISLSQSQSPLTTSASQEQAQPPTLPPLPDQYSTKIHKTSTDPFHVSLHTTTSTHLSLRMFLPCTRDQAISRRSNRSGYVTIEGFWEDPPGYVEDVVWVHYRGLHGWIFGTGSNGSGGGEMEDVDEGRMSDERKRELERDGLIVGPVGAGMDEVLEWGVRWVWKVLEGSLRKGEARRMGGEERRVR